MGAYCVALDPGGTTGVATVASEDEPWTIEARQLTGEHHLELLTYLWDCAPRTIVCESFLHTANEAARLVSSEMIGVVKAYSQSSGTPVVWQSPSIGKSFWTDIQLKHFGLYVAGVQHARDAIRHYAYWRAFTMKDQTIFLGAQASVDRRN